MRNNLKRASWKQLLILFSFSIPILLLASSFYARTSIEQPSLVDEHSKRDEFHVKSSKTPPKDTKVVVPVANNTTTSQVAVPAWQIQGQKLARAFDPWKAKDRYGWCVKRSRYAHGLLFIKIQKCASSTGSGISLNIANNVARRRHQSTCLSHVRHYRTQELPIPSRNKEKSLLWTIVRHPAKRALSSYFFYEISQEGKKPTDKAMLQYLRKEKNFQVEALQESSLSSYTIKDIIQEMDFIAVSERMDESLVVFRLLNGFKRKDMIVLSSKKHGGYDGGMHGSCHKIVPSHATPAIQEYLSTTFEKNNDDYILYAAANASLDKTIDTLGRDLVENEVRYHQYLQRVANKYCQEEAHFPCSDEGEHQLKLSRTSCYERDWGCGHKCVFKTLAGL